jgi:hypothetical protein
MSFVTMITNMDVLMNRFAPELSTITILMCLNICVKLRPIKAVIMGKLSSYEIKNGKKMRELNVAREWKKLLLRTNSVASECCPRSVSVRKRGGKETETRKIKKMYKIYSVPLYKLKYLCWKCVIRLTLISWS